MPGVIGGMIERPKMTRSMYQALKRHILAEREKKKQGKITTVVALIKRQKETVVFWKDGYLYNYTVKHLPINRKTTRWRTWTTEERTGAPEKESGRRKFNTWANERSSSQRGESGFPLIREIREFMENFEDFFQSGKSGKNRGFSAKIRGKISNQGTFFPNHFQTF